MSLTDEAPNSPRHASDALVVDSVRERLNAAYRAGALVGGWLLTGPPQVGKATLAFALAQMVLGECEHLGESNPRARSLIINGGHPDLFVLERRVNEKTGRLRAEIVVDDIREVIHGLHQTATTGHRVVIVDSADDMNRQAANALLKILEEPPAGTLLLLLSSAPGRLLPTIKSRCRKLALPPVGEAALSAWLQREHGMHAAGADDLASASGGRPGRALDLSTGDGAVARDLVQVFWAALATRGDLVGAATALAAKSADEAWPEARQLILDDMAEAIIATGRGAAPRRSELAATSLDALLSAHETLNQMTRRAEALNSDRTQTALMMGLKLREAMKDRHAR